MIIDDSWRGRDKIIFLNFKETYTILQFYLKEKIVHGKVEHIVSVFF